MFAPTFDLEVGQREETPPRLEKATRSRWARRAKAPVATLVMCMMTMGMALAGHAQNVTIKAVQSSITEGATGGSTNADFQVSLDSPSTQDVSVTVATADGTATAGDDYVAKTAKVDFAIGEVGPKTVSVVVNGDNLYEPANGGKETFTLAATGQTGNVTITNAKATGTIQDDETKPVLSISDATPVTEGNGGTTDCVFTVTLSGPSQEATTFNYTASGDTNNATTSATPNVDFQAANNEPGSIAPKNTSTQISVKVIGDLVDETTETFLVTLSSPVGATLGIDQATGTINDDDGPAIKISDGSATEGGNITFFVTLSKASPEAVTVNYDFTDNTATNGLDYTGTAGTITFFPNQTNFNLVVPTIDDNLVEGTQPETFQVNLSGATGGSTFTDSQGTGSIIDDEKPPIVSVNAVSLPEGAAGSTTNFNFTVSLSTPTTQDVFIKYATAPGSTNPATQGVDYKTVTGTLKIDAGTTSKTISVPVIGDNTDELDETFKLTLSGLDTTTATFSNSASTLSTTGTIVNDDGPTITTTDASVKEGNSGARPNVVFNVVLSNPSPHVVKVNYQTSKGGAFPATPGSDYVAAVGTLTFNPGVTKQTINVQVKGDSVNEEDETFLLTLTKPVGGTIPVGNETVTGTIEDDDAAPFVSIGNVTANEGNNNASTVFTFGVSLDRASAQEVRVDFATNDVTAVSTGAKIDYTATSGTIIFNPGETKKTLKVLVNGDNIDEPVETFQVVLSNAVNANLSNNSTGIGTIRDDDVAPQLVINADVASILENGAPVAPATENQVNFVVSLTGEASQDVTFRYQTVDPTVISQQNRPATGGNDYRSTSGIGVIAAGTLSTTIPVVILGDTLDEYDEYFYVTISDPTGASIKRSTASAIIRDDDAAPTVKIAAPAADATAIEGGRNASFPVTVSAVSGRDITVFYTIQPDGANNQATPLLDLAPVSATGATLKGQTTGSIVIPAGTPTTRAINIVIAGLADKLDEPDPENYRVTITGTVPAESGPANNADATAASTLADRNPGFNNFTPGEGNESYNDANNNGTLVTLTGNQFRINNVSQISAVRFGVTTSDLAGSTAATFVRFDSDTQITVRVPNGAKSGKIRIVTNDGTVLTPSDQQADNVFFVNSVVTGFTPTRGLPRHTIVTITGTNANDPLNPITGVRFNGVDANARNSGTDAVINRLTGRITATVPEGAATGPITIVTRRGTIYPPSLDNFTVDTGTAGGIRFVSTPVYDVPENARGDQKTPATPKAIYAYNSNVPVSYTLQLNPAVQGDPARTQVAPRGDVVVLVTISDPAALNGQRVRSPRINVPTGRVRQLNGQSFEVTFDANTFQNKTINVIDAGDDLVKPDFVAGGFFQQQNAQVLTITAAITRSNDPELYPVAATTPNLTINRLDLHGLDTDIGTVFRTTEDQNSPKNITSFKVNLANINNGIDVAADGTPVTHKYSADPQPTVLNSDGTVNSDAEPKREVGLPFQVNNDEALIRYYTMVPKAGGGFTKAYPGGTTFGTRIVVVYGNVKNANEYYKFDHYIEAKGVDDFIQDGPQEYQITLDNSGTGNQNSNSVDPEFLKLNLETPFTLTNDDNEQSVDPNSAGFIFSPADPNLRTDENGLQASFTVRLRTKPAAGTKVTLHMETSLPTEVMLVDPTDDSRSRLVDNLNLVFYPETPSDANGNKVTASRWDSPLTVRVSGVDDSEIDGPQTAKILTSVLANGTTDANYLGIDPIDPTVTNADNENTGITVSKRQLDMDEGTTDTFTVRLNSRPSKDVTLTVTSADSQVAAVVGSSRLTFTTANYLSPQTVTVRAIPDNDFTATRNTNIILSNTTSEDPNFDNLDVPDVAVIVRNKSQAYVVTPSSATDTGIVTSEDGDTATFNVSLASQPTAPVTISLVANSSEVTLAKTGQTGSTVSLTFSTSNFGIPQTVTVRGVDDNIVDGDQIYSITGTITTTDNTYRNQPFPAIPGVNKDNDGTSNGGGTIFAANGTYNISFPYATTADANGTLTQAQAFSLVSGSGTPQFTLYKFNVAGQRNDRALNGGTDFVVVPAGEKLVRGIGYRLVTANNDVQLNTPANVSTLKPYAGTTFSYSLSWNPTFIDDTSSIDNRNNGYNYIGFPFDPSKYTRVSFSSSQVTYGSNVYESIADAAAAGVIDQQLYTVDSLGKLTAVSSNDLQIRPYRAYFVHILRNDLPVTVKLRNPAVQ